MNAALARAAVGRCRDEAYPDSIDTFAIARKAAPERRGAHGGEA
jgi:hypothetical protein